MTTPPGGPGTPTEAIVELTAAQELLAGAVRLLAETQAEVNRTVKVLSLGVRRLVQLLAGVLLLGIIAVCVVVRFGQIIRTEGNAGRQNLKCVVAVLFRQEAPRCIGTKEELLRDGILPPGFPNTTTTTRP